MEHVQIVVPRGLCKQVYALITLRNIVIPDVPTLFNRRPLVASECESLGDAQKWRREIIQDVTRKISAVQNATLGEFRLRELNDDINKLMRKRHYWDRRILELGGTDYKGRKQAHDVEGRELPGQGGYRYYGAAKNLPGVRELFAEEDEELIKKKGKRTRADMHRFVTSDYYGYRDDDDGILATKEAAIETQLIRRSDNDFLEKKLALIEGLKARGAASMSAEDALQLLDEEDEEREVMAHAKLMEQLGSTNTAAANDAARSSEVVSNKQKTEVNKLVVDKKKAMLLDMLL